MTTYKDRLLFPHNDTITDKKVLTKYISAFVLGDGWLDLPKKGINASYKIDQIQAHQDYIEWQANILSTLTSVTVHVVDRVDNRIKNLQTVLRLFTKSHPVYTTIRQRFYGQGIKAVSPHDLKLFEWEVAAIWYMDDGGIQVRPTKSEPYVKVALSTESFSFGDNSLLQKVIYEKLNIPFNIEKYTNKKGNQVYRLWARKDYAKRFIEGISQYILPSFEYKLDYTKINSK
jgi:hypothetical protein